MSEYSSSTGQFKGNPTISIMETREDVTVRVISFGLKKAKAIIAQAEEIKKFIDENDKGKKSNEEGSVS